MQISVHTMGLISNQWQTPVKCRTCILC